MPTTLAADKLFLQNLRAGRTALDEFGKPIAKMPVGREPGKINFSGNHWPDLTTASGKQMKLDVETALAEARDMVFRGLQTAKAALRGDQAAVAIMNNWFGPRQVSPADDWWVGADDILSILNESLLSDINVYYRGSDAQGKANDYPGRGTAPLTAHDVSGYAETYRNQKDLVIGLCSEFFDTDAHEARTIVLKGFDSVGGVLVHEMSHNLCGTLDHTNDANKAYYGTDKCKQFATLRPRSAWYNADNIEYFCEEAHYGTVTAKAPVQGGNVTGLIAKHEKSIVDATL